MSQIGMNEADRMAQAVEARIKAIAQQVYKEVPSDRELEGLVISKDSQNKYTVKINNATYKNIMQERSLGEIKPNTIVKVKVPNNQMNNAYICGVVDGTITTYSNGGGGGGTAILYDELGDNTDGALTQKKSTEELAKMAKKDGSNLNTEDISSWIEKLGLGLPLGTLIHSTKILKNAGLHLADGGELMIGGVYDDFCQYVINNQDEFPNILYDDEDLTVEGAKTALEKWQEEFVTYGQCGKYVITDTYIKLPAITKLTGGLISTEMDKMGSEAKPILPNIKGYFTGTLNGSDGGTGKHEGAFYAYSTGSDSNSWGGNSSWNNTSTEGFDASRYNSIYSSTDRVEAEHLKFPYYIVVATVTKTDIEVNIDNITTDLNNKIGKTECVRYPISKYISSDGSAWYTIYNDGWKECGGKATGVSYSSSTLVTLPLPDGFSNTNYTITGSVVNTNTGHYFEGVYFIASSTTQAKMATSHNGGTASAYPVRYYACGY